LVPFFSCQPNLLSWLLHNVKRKADWRSSTCYWITKDRIRP
jgi:hypothetical protein